MKVLYPSNMECCTDMTFKNHYNECETGMIQVQSIYKYISTSIEHARQYKIDQNHLFHFTTVQTYAMQEEGIIYIYM